MVHRVVMTSVKGVALAPDFLLMDDEGNNVSLDSFIGKNLVVYFYPKDDTPVCRKEAVDFSEAAGEFSKLNTVILGVSTGTVNSHQHFKEKHNIEITLLSDIGHRMAEAYGVWVEKTMFGKKYMGTKRATFLIGKERNIVKIWNKVKIWGHIDDVLNSARELHGAG